MSRRVVFLDRDGTINEDTGYLNDPESLVLIKGALEAIRELKRAGFRVIIVTNQSGIARGIISERALAEIHGRLLGILKSKGITIDGIYHCPHHPDDGCECRKPGIGLLEKAVRDLNIDLKSSYVVGDKVSDVELAYKSGIKGVLVLTGYGRKSLKELEAKPFKPCYVARDLWYAASWIIKDRES